MKFMIEEFFRIIPKNFKYASTINFWNSIILLIIQNKIKPISYKSIFEPISFGIMLIGTKQVIYKKNSVLQALYPENIIQHILPYVINIYFLRYKYGKVDIASNILSIYLVFTMYLLYVSYFVDNEIDDIYNNFNNDMFQLIIIQIMYILVRRKLIKLL